MNDRVPTPLPDGGPRHCPLNHTNCLGIKCAFWIELTVKQPSPITGVQHLQAKNMCVFVAQLEISILTLNKPVAISPAGGILQKGML